LTERLISHQELLNRLWQHDVTLVTLKPQFYHLWGRRMEEAWIGDMPRFLEATERSKTEREKQDEARLDEAG
jgi:hypothetical protein